MINLTLYSLAANLLNLIINDYLLKLKIRFAHITICSLITRASLTCFMAILTKFNIII